ncbi:MAG: flagellar assembly peptidoglycan hydrolase FlgJ, partial [Pseudomonadota bacterium]|nr:flagellar assembly peptidoglycan hydrolase FlgJ [Pseudomonadota bacterium]
TAAEVQSNFNDLSGLNSIRQLGSKDKDAALEKIAKQFESILMHQMLKSMRQANAVFEKDSMFNSSETNFHRDMLDHQLTLSLAEGKGIGLADALVRQLKQSYGDVQRKSQSDNELQFQMPTPKKASQTSDDVQEIRWDSPEAFVESVMPFANEAAEKLGVDPKVLISQAALETGWGKHVIRDSQGNSSHNLFNIKADSRWQGDGVSVKTLEYRNGLPKPEMASFRRYESYGQSFADYVEFIQGNPRYRQALEKANDPEAYVRELQNAGYATDPFYAEKITSIFSSDSLNVATK